MGYLVKMPKLGLEMKEGTLVAWRIEEGGEVTRGDVVAEVESEKSVSEVEARESGVVRRTFLSPGETVEPGTPMAIVAGADEDVSALEAEAGDGVDVGGESEAESGGGSTEERTASAETGEGPAASERGAVKASPRARQRADELGVDLGSVSGSGPQGSVTEADVEAAAEAGGGEAEAGGGPGIGAGPAPLTVAEERPFSGMRKTIADRLGESYRNAVHVTEHRTVDAEALFEATAAAKEALDADVSLPDLLLVALSAALDDHPAFNATFEDGTHRVYEEHNVGVAVDIDAGLVAPVIPDVGGKSLADVARARREVTRRALDGDYSMDDLANGTFTVTNLGVLGVESFDPVINPPQVAILGVDAIDERPVADDGDVTVRRQLPLDLSFDHRVVDGADAARFLESLAVHLEDPWPLLPESVRAARGGEREASETPKRYARSHSPEGLGGTVSSGDAEWTYGDGATPLEMFVGSLAGCLSVFLRLRADEEGVSLGAVDVAAEAHPKDGDVERVDVTATLESDAPDDRLDRIVDYAEQDCYVRRLVRDDVTVEVSWERA